MLARMSTGSSFATWFATVAIFASGHGARGAAPPSAAFISCVGRNAVRALRGSKAVATPEFVASRLVNRRAFSTTDRRPIKMQSQPKLELYGKIKVIFDEMQVGANNFRKREFVVTSRDMYPQDIKFDVVQDKCSLLDGFSPGDDVKVSFNIRGNLWNSKYYVNLQAWRIERDSGEDDLYNAEMQGGWSNAQAPPSRGGGGMFQAPPTNAAPMYTPVQPGFSQPAPRRTSSWSKDFTIPTKKDMDAQF